MNATAGPQPSAAEHEALIHDQFSRQAPVFSQSSELHGQAQVAMLVEAARPQPGDCSLDVACGPGSVVAAFAGKVRFAVGLDTTEPMLDQARKLAAERSLPNVEWRTGDVYRLPFADSAFDIVTCRFAVHHFQRPAAALGEMARVCRSGGRLLVCDGVASNDADKALAFNTMERHRDPSTVEFRTLTYLRELFRGAGLPPPAESTYQVAYECERMIAQSFPAGDDRDTLRAMIAQLIAGDAMDSGTVAGSPQFVYPVVILTATKP